MLTEALRPLNTCIGTIHFPRQPTPLMSGVSESIFLTCQCIFPPRLSPWQVQALLVKLIAADEHVSAIQALLIRSVLVCTLAMMFALPRCDHGPATPRQACAARSTSRPGCLRF